ncbi:MAG: MCE family protein [Flavobacteriaceae bacterium]|nr:MCE family protein [Flavobacteriaceae bacterium]
MKLSREIKTGILVVAGLLLIVFTFNYLKGQNLLDTSRKVYAIYDNVEGLAIGSPVTINGYAVGKVQHIELTKNDQGKLMVKVLLLLEDKFGFSKNSKAELYDTNLIGGKSIAIIPAFDNAENVQSGDMLKGVKKESLTESLGQTLTPIQAKLDVLMTNANALISNLNDVFNEETKQDLKLAIGGLDTTISSFKTLSHNLNGLVLDNKAKLDQTLSNLDNVSKSLSEADFAKLINEFDTTITNLNSVLSNLEKGEGTIGKLLVDNQLYENLEGATKELEELLRDIKIHPKRYFRILSKKEIPYEKQ